MEHTCPNCGHEFKDYVPPYARERTAPPAPKLIKFTSDGQIYTAHARSFNDSFYEITEGKFKGNLVHLFDIIK